MGGEIYMIVLDKDLFIGKGAHKNCYIHPLNENLCIKVSREKREKIVEKEIKYYKFLKKTGFDSSIIPKYFGTVETNFGKGHVFELIRDYDGKISKPVDYYLKKKDLYPDFLENFSALRKRMYKNNLITRKLKERNLLFKKFDEKKGEIVIIDDIGPSELIPIGLYFSFFAKKKIKRKLEEFKKKIEEVYFKNN